MLGWELPPHNSGGLGVACLELCKSLAGSGADIDFILPYRAHANTYSFINIVSALPQYSAPDLQQSAYTSHLLLNTAPLARRGNQETDEYTAAASKIASRREFDIIHAHDWLTFRAALRVKEDSGKPLIVHVHSIERDRAGGAPGNPMVREIEATGMMLADRVIAVSERTRQMIAQEYSIPLSKIDVIHNSIDPESLEPLDAANVYTYLVAMKILGWRVVVNVGRLTIQKGLPGLITAAADVIKRAPKTLFLFVGSGEQKEELIMQAAALGIGDNVIFVGFQRGKKLRDAFAVGDLFVLPSVSEPFGLTPLEAIGYGTPVLISRQSGVSEVLDNCLKVDFWDTAEMANKITAVVMNDNLRDEMLRNSEKEYQNLSWGASAQKLINIYHRHLAEPVYS